MNNLYFKNNGKRLTSNKVKVSLTKNGQYSLTIPKSLALLVELKKGSIVVWTYSDDNYLSIKKEDETNQ